QARTGRTGRGVARARDVDEVAAVPGGDEQALRAPRLVVAGDHLQPLRERAELLERVPLVVDRRLRRRYGAAAEEERRHPVRRRVGAPLARRPGLVARGERRSRVRRGVADEAVVVRDAGLAGILDRV